MQYVGGCYRAFCKTRCAWKELQCEKHRLCLCEFSIDAISIRPVQLCSYSFRLLAQAISSSAKNCQPDGSSPMLDEKLHWNRCNPSKAHNHGYTWCYIDTIAELTITLEARVRNSVLCALLCFHTLPRGVGWRRKTFQRLVVGDFVFSAFYDQRMDWFMHILLY